MRNVFDHLGRTIGLTALTPCGLTIAEHLIAPDARRADLFHDPDPARADERARLGLLGRIASSLCLIEIYSSAPAEDDALACVGKLIAFRQRRRREARNKQKKLENKLGRKLSPEPFVRPFGWILAAGCPVSVLAGIAATPAAGWPPGVYFSPGVLLDPSNGDILLDLDGAGGMLRLGIVVASELPRDRSTLLVRFMAAGPLLADALADLAALPEGAHEHGVAEQILVDLQQMLGKKPGSTEEEEFIVNILSTFAKEREEGRTEGREQGRTEGEARALMTALRVRGIPVSEAARERILAEKDPAQLERWIERAIFAASVAEVLDEPNQAA